MNPVTAFRRSAGVLRKALTELTNADGAGTKAIARVLVREIRKRAPTDDAGDGARHGGTKRLRKAGHLKRSIRHAKVDGVRRVGTDDFVAPFQEFGIPMRETGSLPPQPFFRPGLAAAKGSMTTAAAGELKSRMPALLAKGG